VRSTAKRAFTARLSACSLPTAPSAAPVASAAKAAIAGSRGVASVARRNTAGGSTSLTPRTTPSEWLVNTSPRTAISMSAIGPSAYSIVTALPKPSRPRRILASQSTSIRQRATVWSWLFSGVMRSICTSRLCAVLKR
jgi:hypothetical protein